MGKGRVRGGEVGRRVQDEGWSLQLGGLWCLQFDVESHMEGKSS